MSFSRSEMAENLLRLKDNAHFRYYVQALEKTYNSMAEQLLLSDHPDEALRGEARAYLKLLKQISQNSGT